MLFSTTIVAALASLTAAKLKPRADLDNYEYCLSQCSDQFAACIDTTGEVDQPLIVLGIDTTCSQETGFCQSLCTLDDLAFGAEEKVPKA